MKKYIGLLTIILMLAACAKKPYAVYQETYKTEGAKKFDDQSVDQTIANQKNIKHMTLAEARAARLYFEGRNDIELVEKVLAHIMKISDNYQEKADCLYELATIQLSLGRLEKARELFEQLLREYPGITFKKEALYRQILAYYWDCSDAERDQGMTEQTLKLAQEFLQAYPTDPEYFKPLEAIQDYCYQLLFQAEFLRLNFYFTKYQINNDLGALKAAQMRLRHLVENLVEHQKNLSSTTKDGLVELCVQLNAVEDSDEAARAELMKKALLLLTAPYERV